MLDCIKIFRKTAGIICAFVLLAGIVFGSSAFSMATGTFANTFHDSNISFEDTTSNDTISAKTFFSKKTILPRRLLKIPILDIKGLKLLKPHDWDPSYDESFIFWKLISFSGELSIKGVYRLKERINENYVDSISERYLTGGVSIISRSFFLNPNFIIIDLKGKYAPGANRENHIIIPDRAEINSYKELDIKTTFLQKKKINLIAFYNLSENFQNRENLTNIKSENKNLGATVLYRDVKLPFGVNFNKGQGITEEIETGRITKQDIITFNTLIRKSFTTRDNNDLIYTYNDNQRIYGGNLLQSFTQSLLKLNSKFFLDTAGRHILTSYISAIDQKGFLANTRFIASENIKINLLKNLNLLCNYTFTKNKGLEYKTNGHNISSSLEHMLFKSLRSKVFVDYTINHHTNFAEKKINSGLSLKYNKKIPIGKLWIDYTYNHLYQKRTTDLMYMNIVNEELLIKDDLLVLLDNPYVDINSIVVKDSTLAFVYQINLDYILIPHGNYIEIKRVPGGLISNNSSIYVDYTALQPGNFNYNSNGHNLRISLTLLRDHLDIYYKKSAIGFNNLIFSDFIILDSLRGNTFGGVLNFSFIQGGAEYESHKSTIVPYNLTYYFITINKGFSKKVIVGLNGSYQNFSFTEENIHQLYYNASGIFSYNFNPKIKLNLNIAYRRQKGEQLNLDLLFSTAELSMRFRQISIKTGIEFYKQFYAATNLNFRGLYFQLSRSF